MTSDIAEVGTCSLCGQEMIRTWDDCWHPWDVPVACPPEPEGSDIMWWVNHPEHRTGRPGREYFVLDNT